MCASSVTGAHLVNYFWLKLVVVIKHKQVIVTTGLETLYKIDRRDIHPAAAKKGFKNGIPDTQSNLSAYFIKNKLPLNVE